MWSKFKKWRKKNDLVIRIRTQMSIIEGDLIALDPDNEEDTQEIDRLLNNHISCYRAIEKISKLKAAR